MLERLKQRPLEFVASVLLFITSGFYINVHLLAYHLPPIGWFGYYSHLIALLLVARFVMGWEPRGK